MTKEIPFRLFVPLTKESFIDFRDNGKEVEVRKNERQYTVKTVFTGRPVELRLGYSGRESIWGTIGDIVVGTWDDIFHYFPLQRIEPSALTIEYAIGENIRLMGISQSIIAFQIIDRKLEKNRV